MNNDQELKTSQWLADRLGLSLSTVERLRAKQSPDLPPHLTIGKSIRYDAAVVETWLQQQLNHQQTTNGESNE
jgi:predicted DNA-binding transcriptional regulator AlpA